MRMALDEHVYKFYQTPPALPTTKLGDFNPQPGQYHSDDPRPSRFAFAGYGKI